MILIRGNSGREIPLYMGVFSTISQNDCNEGRDVCVQRLNAHSKYIYKYIPLAALETLHAAVSTILNTTYKMYL